MRQKKLNVWAVEPNPNIKALKAKIIMYRLRKMKYGLSYTVYDIPYMIWLTLLKDVFIKQFYPIVRSSTLLLRWVLRTTVWFEMLNVKRNKVYFVLFLIIFVFILVIIFVTPSFDFSKFLGRFEKFLEIGADAKTF